jgi:hypothetical protein
MQELRSSYIGELKIGVSGSYPLGKTPLGWRRLDRLDFGHFKGPRINGEIATGGLDLLLGGGDDALRPDVRLIVKLDDGEPLLIQYLGVRHASQDVMDKIARNEPVAPDSHYLRTSMVFETGSTRYDWLNRIVGVGIGRREPGFAIYDVYEIL